MKIALRLYARDISHGINLPNFSFASAVFTPNYRFIERYTFARECSRTRLRMRKLYRKMRILSFRISLLRERRKIERETRGEEERRGRTL